MRLTPLEIEFLAAWAREEWEPDCYQRHAHRLQLSHGAVGAYLIDLIKAWTETADKPDRAILEAASNLEPSWPWNSDDEFSARICEAQEVLRAATPGRSA